MPRNLPPSLDVLAARQQLVHEVGRGRRRGKIRKGEKAC